MTEDGPAKFGKNAGTSDRRFSKFGAAIFQHFWGPFPECLVPQSCFGLDFPFPG